ncbi:MAG: amidohydrolase family protein [Rhodospirillaceae bacterium]|nr:amidohydrolase family protein [Rhodospirillaceae bacterium]
MPRASVLYPGLMTALLGVAGAAAVQAQPPDLILTNGKIITVDDQFSIAQAVAVRGEWIVAVGTDAAVGALAGADTRRMDLQGRAVVPGMIDNHAHFMEEGAYWLSEHRLDGSESRTRAVAMMRARAAELGPGGWVFTLGGWSPDQFADDDSPFTREELDAVAPDNPVLLQFTRCCTYLNSRAIEALGLQDMDAPWIERDGNGRATGVIDAAGANRLTRHLVAVPPEPELEAGGLAMIADLNRAGITSSGGACQFPEMYRRWQREGRLGMRFFCFRTVNGGARAPDEVDAVIAGIPQLEYFQGDNWIDYVNWGERLYNVNDNMTDFEPTVEAGQFEHWGRIARAAAEAGIPIFIHSTLEPTIEGQLREVEAIARDYPIKTMRWTFKHMEQVTPDQLERMKRLGMYVGVHPRATIMGGIYLRVHGERGYHMPPLKTIQDSGILWGLGTDAFEVNQYRPFTTLWWAVTGKMVGGRIVNREPVSREQALIAHTRNNALFFFRENELGSIAPGKLADLLVLDRDYLTVPADEIKDINPVITMVGGRIVFDAGELDAG